jgi:hypothetical protein
MSSKSLALLPTSDSVEQDRKSVFAKCEVDPIKAQDDAMISVALKLQKNQMSVNEFSVDEARTTMVRSNYAPDWTRANWSHPLLANLKNLSCLSSFDLPSETKRGLVDEKKAIAYGMIQQKKQGEKEEEENEEQQQQQQQQQNQDPSSTKSRSLIVSPAATTITSSVVVRNEVIEPAALNYALEHKTPAIVETTPFILRQKALLDLSPETINSDPQLLALVSAIAAANKTDPRVAGKVAMGEIPTIPVIPQVPSIRNTYPVHRKACDALPKPSSVASGDHNKGFHDSDIVGYRKLRDELEPPFTSSSSSVLELQQQQQQNENQEGNSDENNNTISPVRSPRENGASSLLHHSVRGEAKKSMHDVGYRTWMQKNLEQPSEYEDRERFEEYRDQVTSLQGKCLSVSEKI